MKKHASGKFVGQSATDQAVSRNLLQLNFHRTLSHNFRGFQILDDFRQKQQGGCIFGRAYIEESASRLNEALYGSCFHVNALTDGHNTELFARLDELKFRINAAIETSAADEAYEDGQLHGGDEVTRLLARVIRETCDAGGLQPAVPHQGLPDQPTAADMLTLLSELTLEIVERRLDTAAGLEGRSNELITSMPVGYVQRTGAQELSITGDSTGATGYEAARLLTEGIEEVAALRAPDLEAKRTDTEVNLKAVIMHSPNAVTLTAASRFFRCVMGAAVFDAVGGNYIYLLIAPRGPEVKTAVGRLLLKSLYWLDFETSYSPKVICAGIRNRTREEIGDHLSMLGRLLSFVSIKGEDLDDDESILTSMDHFLETIV